MTVSVSSRKQKHVSVSMVLLQWLLVERTEVVTGWAAEAMRQLRQHVRLPR
jgi:hypothetical protein